MRFHKKISEELDNYASRITDIIQEPKGELIYAGGDDVLAFVNLNYLFSVIGDLRAAFPKFGKSGFKIKHDEESSISAGIAIAHYMTPLPEVLKWARNMESEAKKKDGKDAFAIAILKRSGNISKATFKWQYAYATSPTTDILQYLVKSLQTDFSNTFITGLKLEFARLMDKKGNYGNRPLVKTEIGRLIKRSCMMKKRENEGADKFKERKEEAIRELTDKLYALFSDSLSNFLYILSSAEFIERGGDL